MINLAVVKWLKTITEMKFSGVKLMFSGEVVTTFKAVSLLLAKH